MNVKGLNNPSLNSYMRNNLIILVSENGYIALL